MQDPTSFSAKPSPASPPASNLGMPEIPPLSEPAATAETAPQEPAASGFEQSLAALRDTLDEHKGKLAIGAAATLGLMVYYKWREKKLAEEEPQEYERLQRIKSRVRHADESGTAGDTAGTPSSG